MSNAHPVTDADLANIIGSESAHARFSLLRWLGMALALALAVGGFVWFQFDPATHATAQYQTEPLSRGDLRVTVLATGKLAPINEVDVGSELSGTIEAVLVDYNERVKKGQVLARLDVAKLRDQLAKSKAALASAEAKVLQAVATVKEARANLGRLQQVARLSGGKALVLADLETAETTLQRANADEASTRAAVEETRATVRSNETDLSKASIRSPIDGVVLKRAVEPGQTVAATLQVVVLFTLAENLAQMELQVDVDEADVAQVHAGQTAAFTVDAHPNRRYPARISLVRFGAETVNNVVTYKAVLNVNNDDLSLRPGMTASAEIVTVERENVLLVPNAALRFTPPKPATPTPSSGGLVASLLPRPPASVTTKSAAKPADKNVVQQVWTLRDGQPVAVPVTVSSSNERITEVTGNGLEPGLPVIVAHLETPP